jgi:uncharacterized protein YbbC (DUF1343 family)
MTSPPVIPGDERLFAECADLIHGRRLGLITNPSGVDRSLRPTSERLRAAGCQLVALFSPEHGLYGQAADGVQVAATRDPRTGVPVHSLYGATLRPDAGTLAGVDVMLFDIQDVGARFYTYLYTMSLSMEASAARGIPFVVLDRPNPNGGSTVAGALLDPAFASFVGRYPIPVQYGLTLGELARLFNEVFHLGAELHVVPLQGWRRSFCWEDTGLLWVPPSPNMPTADTARVYPGTCFCEGTNLSEGRGTAKPFEQVGAPFVDGYRLSDWLNGLDLPGAIFRAVCFQPTASKHAGQLCQGVQIHVRDRRCFQAVRTGLEILAAVRRFWPAAFAWRQPENGIHPFDRLAGTDRIRLGLERGIPVPELAAGWEEPLQAFRTLRQDFLLYP